MAQYADRIAVQWIAGKKTDKSPRLCPAYFQLDPGYIAGIKTTDSDTPRALYSYGPHYPVAIEELEFPGYWVNETPYYTTEDDRMRLGGAFDNSSAGPFYVRTRKRTPSPTTKGHCASVASALRAAGFAPTTATRTIELEGTDGEPLTHTLRLWLKAPITQEVN